MTKEEIEAEWLAIPEGLSKVNPKQSAWKAKRKELSIAWLSLHKVNWFSGNQNIHIQIDLSDGTHLDFWPTTHRLNVTNPDGSIGRNNTTKDILETLNFFLVNT